MSEQYAYAVARVRAKEMSLLNKQDIDQLVSCKNINECISFLQDKSWGKGESNTINDILNEEQSKLWNFIKEILDDKYFLEIFSIPIDYNNLKTAIKSVIMNSEAKKIFLQQGSISPEIILKAVEEKSLELLPKSMRNTVLNAREVLLQTSDGQLCDVIVDRAALIAILEAGKRSKNEIIKNYAHMFVVLADIKTAVRGCLTFKSFNFLMKSMAPCNGLDIKRLATAASKSIEEIYEYLLFTDYRDCVEELKKSMASFEKWCDNKILDSIKSQKYNSFTLSPIFAYAFAKQNEIKQVRMISIAKEGGLNDDIIRERLRDMYV